MSAENAPAPRSSRAPGAGTSQALIREHASNELVFAVVGHAGAGTSTVATQLKEVLENSALKGGPFEVRILKASGEITAWARSRGEDPPEGQGDNIDRIAWLQDKGDEMRKEDHAAVAIAMAARIRAVRAERQNAKLNIDEPVVPDGTRRAYIVDSIKHPAEVHLLRSIYQTAFTLVGAVCEEEVRVRRLMTKYGNAGEKRARDFMARDALEKEKKYGQRVAEAFHLADVFLDNTQAQLLKEKRPNPIWTIPDQLGRLVKLITHADIVRPTFSESAMYAAYGAKLRSSCLSRQVGAAVMDRKGTIVTTGTNEAPCAGGGVCLEPDPGERCSIEGRCAYSEDFKACSNTKERNEIIANIIESIPELKGAVDRVSVEQTISASRIGSLIEFSRAVHAEMDAVLSAGRQGVSLTGGRLFVTAFPCHYCARHIVAAGLDEVQFIEPYFKSQALKLYKDSITMEIPSWKAPSLGGQQVLFRPFTGVAPRMYERAFLKDRPLKNETTGDLEIGEPDWGSAWDIIKISYTQLEMQLAKRSG